MTIALKSSFNLGLHLLCVPLCPFPDQLSHNLTAGKLRYLLYKHDAADELLVFSNFRLHPLVDVLVTQLTLGVILQHDIRSWPLFVVSGCCQ